MDPEYQRQVSLGFGWAQTCLSHSWDQVSSHAMVHDASTLRFWGVEFIGLDDAIRSDHAQRRQLGLPYLIPSGRCAQFRD
jgi:hypothetical protein